METNTKEQTLLRNSKKFTLRSKTYLGDPLKVYAKMVMKDGTTPPQTAVIITKLILTEHHGVALNAGLYPLREFGPKTLYIQTFSLKLETLKMLTEFFNNQFYSMI